MINLEVKLNNLILKNPITVASGTYGYGTEYLDLYSPEELGAVFLKGITIEERCGNAAPRVVETPSGMINAVGLQNVGLERFIKEKIPVLKNLKGVFIANISGKTIEEYVAIAESLKNEDIISGIEINVSCPNIKQGGIQFGADPDMILKITEEVRRVYEKCIIVKLSPNVTNIIEMALAAERGGADAVCIANTFLAMRMDVKNRKPCLANKVGGLSGPAIRPIVVRMIYQTAKAIKIPIIGCGGIFFAEDALEYFLAGSRAVSVGTATFNDPYAPLKILDGVKKYMEENNYNSIEEINKALIDD